MKDLQGNRAIVPDIVRQIHRGHPAAAQLTLDGVGAGESSLEGRARVGQG
jgi:hypothetical protein